LDLKLDNILIGNDFKLKICDFAMAKPASQKLTTIQGTISYMAPEVFNEDTEDYYGVQADIFALGVIMFMLCIGHAPFATAQRSDRWYRYLQKNPDYFFQVQPNIKTFLKTNKRVALDDDVASLIDMLLS
jgi:serine/threonine protein kinase